MAVRNRVRRATAAQTAAKRAVHSSNGILDQVKEMGTEARDMAEEQLDHVKAAAKQYLKAGRKRALSMERSMEACVGDQPMKSLLVTAAGAFLVGFFFGRR